MSSLSLRRSARLVSAPQKPSTSKTAAGVVRHHAEVSAIIDDSPRPTKRARKEKTRSQINATSRKPAQSLIEDHEAAESRKKPTRRKAEVIEPTPADFAPRADNPWRIGPHVSSAGGVENTIVNAAAVGANAFALFLKSQRKWASSPLTTESVASFKSRMKAFGYSAAHILPHGSYLVNLGNPDEEKREKSYKCFLDDLKRCEQLGLHLYNFHPGSTVGQATVEESLSFIADCINRAHKDTECVVVVLENMAGSGNVIGSHFSELGGIIKQVRDKSRVGVCLDTCHVFAAGYEIRTKEGWDLTMAEFECEVGLKYLRGMHLNDSKVPLGSKKDRHENIGLGELGLRTFAHVLSDPRTQDLPLILETPAFDTSGPSGGLGATGGMDVWKKEVEVLNRVSMRNGEVQLEDWREEIARVVKNASSAKDARGKRRATSGSATRRGRGRDKKLEKNKEKDDNGEDTQCESCHEDEEN